MTRAEIIKENQDKAEKLIAELIRALDLPKAARESVEAVTAKQLEAIYDVLNIVTRQPED